MFLALVISHLPRHHSDHSHILLKLFRGGRQKKNVKKFFLFKKMLLKHPKLEEVISRAWEGSMHSVEEQFIQSKISKYGEHPRIWNSIFLANIQKQMKESKEELAKLLRKDQTKDAIR